MKTRDTVTGWTVGLLALQIACQGFFACVVTTFSTMVFEDSVQTLDGLVLTPLSGLIFLLIQGFGIFRTLRLSLIVTLIMLLPWIDAAIVLGRDTGFWDADIQGTLTDPAHAVQSLTATRYAVFALIAGLTALAAHRAWSKAKARA